MLEERCWESDAGRAMLEERCWKSDVGRAMLGERCWESDAKNSNLNVHKRMLNYGLQSISLSNQNDIRVRFSSHSVGMGYWFDK